MHAKTTGTARNADEATLRTLVNDWVLALTAKDADGVVRDYADDVVVFDPMSPQPIQGVRDLRDKWVKMFAQVGGELKYELRDLTFEVDRDLATCHSLNRLQATLGDGQAIDESLRATVIFRRTRDRRGEAWKVIHEHASAAPSPPK